MDGGGAAGCCLRRLASGSFVHMAASWWFIVLCGAGRTVLAVTSNILIFMCGWNMLMFHTIFVAALLLLVESSWLNYELEQQQQLLLLEPGDICYLVQLIVAEWLLAIVYCAMAYSALISDLADTPRGGRCELAAYGTACAAGALAAASAVGLLYLICSRLSQDEAPHQQPQA